jgi:hypothetical protein
MTNNIDFGTSKAVSAESRSPLSTKRGGPCGLCMHGALGIIMAFLLLAGYSQAASVTVCETQEEGAFPCDYLDIQSAIDAASPGDIIEIESGTYAGNVALRKEVTLSGLNTGAGLPFLDGIIYLCGHNETLLVKLLYQEYRPGYPESETNASSITPP